MARPLPLVRTVISQINIPIVDHHEKGKGFQKVGSDFGHGGGDQGN